MPDNSQNFNRYSYCLNNPLKYTDPSGELFGIDDAIIAFAMVNMVSSMAQASFNGGNVWKAGGLSLLSSAASYGIGSWFGHGIENFKVGHELMRAGAHGLSSGAINVLEGSNFYKSFAYGFLSSLGGSSLQAAGVKSSSAITGACTVTGGLAAWALGDSFLNGASIEANIGAYNHGWTTLNGEKVYELDAVEIIGESPYRLPGSVINNIFNYSISGFTNDRNFRFYIVSSAIDYSVANKSFGIKTVERMSRTITPNFISSCKRACFAGNLLYNSNEIYIGYQADGGKISTIGRYTAKAVTKTAVSGVLSWQGAEYGAMAGAYAGAHFGGVGVLPGALIGGAAGAFLGDSLGDFSTEYLFNTFGLY